jgi:two-component system LytT family response regulator
MLRVLIVDDEPLARRALRQLLAAHSDVAIVADCEDGVSARERLASTPIDLVLLDIRMPEISGLEVAAGASGPPYVVFVTAHEQFGVPAFDVGAADYLLKPVTQARIDAALARVRARIAADRDAASYRAGAPSGPPSVHRDHLVARVGSRDVVIRVEDIELIAAADVYAGVHAHGRRYLVRTSLDELERQLDPDRFARVHRSYLVPVAAVVAFRRIGRGQVLELANGATVPVSRRRRHELLRRRQRG